MRFLVLLGLFSLFAANSCGQEEVAIAAKYKNPEKLYKAEFEATNTFKMASAWSSSGSKRIIWNTPRMRKSLLACAARMQMQQISQKDLDEAVKPEQFIAGISISVMGGAYAADKAISKKYLPESAILLLEINGQIIRPVGRGDPSASLNPGANIHQVTRVGSAVIANNIGAAFGGGSFCREWLFSLSPEQALSKTAKFILVAADGDKYTTAADLSKAR